MRISESGIKGSVSAVRVERYDGEFRTDEKPDYVFSFSAKLKSNRTGSTNLYDFFVYVKENGMGGLMKSIVSISKYCINRRLEGKVTTLYPTLYRVSRKYIDAIIRDTNSEVCSLSDICITDCETNDVLVCG